jgi:hypothetical protein
MNGGRAKLGIALPLQIDGNAARNRLRMGRGGGAPDEQRPRIDMPAAGNKHTVHPLAHFNFTRSPLSPPPPVASRNSSPKSLVPSKFGQNAPKIGKLFQE